MEIKTRQQRRAEERKIVRGSLSKSDRRRLARMKKSKSRAIFSAILEQTGYGK